MRAGAAVSEEELLAYEASCGCCRRVRRPAGGRRSRDGLGGAVPVRRAVTQPDGDRRTGSVGDRRARSDGRARPIGDRRPQPTGLYADADPRAPPDSDRRPQPDGGTRPDGDRGAEPVAAGRAQPDGATPVARSDQVAPMC
jgi:hypothetical protein